MTVQTVSANLPGPPAIDYTSRDFTSIRDDLITLISHFMPEWTSRSANDPGIALLELFAYLGDNLHYYIDRVANEAYIDTATQRANVIRLARMLGYTPSLGLAAVATLTVTNNTSSAVTVNALSQVTTSTNNVTDTPVTFETDSAVTVTANGSATVTAHQGITVSGESVATSDGTQFQTYPLFNTNVVQGSVKVTVNGVSWTSVSRLVTTQPQDQVFTLITDENNVTYLQFGDGTNGQIPGTGQAISATYRIGGGLAGNVSSGTLTTWVSGGIPAGVTVTNLSSASAGADPESTDSIRTNAVKSLTALNRAVTLNDYANLAVTVSGCGKASAASSVYNSVTVYVAPQNGGGFDGVGGTSGNPLATLTALEADVLSYLNTVKPATSTVTVLGPTYVPINITVNLHLSPQVSQAVASASASVALNNLLSFDNVIFGDQISPNDVYLALSSVPGVLYSDLTVLSSGTSGVAVVSMTTNQIPVVGTITVTAVGGTA